MNAIMFKGERSKLLAVAVVFAMIACALVAFMPSADAYEPTDVAEGAVTVDTVDELQQALDDVTVTTINVVPGTYGSDDPATGYGVYVVDRPVTIKALDPVDKPTIYGTFNIRASGNVVIDGLEIIITYTSTTERNAINVLSNDVEIRNCVITMDEDSSDLCNGIMIWPDAGTQKYVIEGNTFNGLVSSANYASVAIAVAENLDLSGYADRFGIPGLTGTTSTLSADVLDVIRNIVSKNTYNGCDWKYSAADYATDAVGDRVLGDFEGNYSQNSNYYATSDDGKQITLLKQTSDKLDLEFEADESFIIDENAVYDGTATGTTNVVNNGAQIAGTTATVMNFDALTAVIGMSDVTTIILGDDITFERNTNIGTKTVNLNGHNLIVGDYNLNAYNGKIIVSAESTLSFNGIVKISQTGLDAQAGSTIYYGTQEASFYNTGSPDSTGLKKYKFYPEFGSDSQVSILNASGIRNLYTIFHSTSVQGVDVQFGLTTNNVIYDCQSVTEGEFTILPLIFEEDWTMTSFVPSVNTTGMLNAGPYKDAIRVSLGLNPVTAGSTDYAVPIVYLDAIILQRAPGISLEVPDWNYGDAVPAFTTEAVGVIDEVIAGSWTYEYFQGQTSFGTDASKLLPGNYSVIGTFTPSAYPEGNYSTNTYTTTFTVNPAQLSMEFGEVANTDDLFWGTDTDRYMYYGEGDLAYDVAVSVDGKTVSISGGIYYIDNVNEGAIVEGQPVTIFGTGQDKGYYALLNIVNPNTFSVKVQVGAGDAKTIPGMAEGVDNTLQLMIYIGTQLTTDTATMIITPDEADTGFGAATYTLDYSGLERMTTSGYQPGTSAVDDLAAEGVTRADANVDEVMWIVFDGKENAEQDIYGYLVYDGKVVYSEELPQGEFYPTESTDSGRVWYFSFADGQGVATYVADPANGVTGYTVGAEGQYDMYISTSATFDPSSIVESEIVAQATEYIGGNLDSGFEYFAEDAIKGIKFGNPDFAKDDDVDNKTLWFNWYQDAAYDSLTITLYKGTDASGTQVHTETTDRMAIGYHTFYASFNNQLKDVAEPIGTYFVTVYAGETLVVSGNIEVKAEASDFTVDESAQDPVLDRDLADIQSGIEFTANADNENQLDVTGQLVYIPAGGFPGYMEGSAAGYYLAINVNAADFPWAKYFELGVEIGNIEIDPTDVGTGPGKWDGTHVFYLGADIDALADPVITVDYDGDGDFFTPKTVTLNTDGLDAKEYEVIFTDAYNDTISHMMYPGEYVDFFNGANAPDFLYWQDENGGVHYFGSQAVISSKYDTNGDYVIEFTAHYGATGPEHSLEYWANHAVDFDWNATDYPYDYKAVFAAYSQYVIAYYGLDVEYELEDILYDFARYMGALYNISGGEVAEVTFDGVTYTWVDGLLQEDGETPIKGSKWAIADENGVLSDADGNRYTSLMNAVVAYANANMEGAIDLSINMELANDYETYVLNYGISIEMPEPTFDVYFDGVLTFQELSEGDTVTLPAYEGELAENQIFLGWKLGNVIFTDSQYTVSYLDETVVEDVLGIYFTAAIYTIPAAEPEAPSVVIDGIPTSFVTGQEYVFTVSTYGDYVGMVKGTGAFTADEGSYTIEYLENDGEWHVLEGDLFGPVSSGFPFTDGATSYFKVVFNEAGNWDLTIDIVPVDTTGAVAGEPIASDDAKVIVLEASDLPELDTREPRQIYDYTLKYEIGADGKYHIYVVTDKVDPTVYRNALDLTRMQIDTDTTSETIRLALSDGYLSDGTLNMYVDEDGEYLIVADYAVELPGWINFFGELYYADGYWHPLGGGYQDGFKATGIAVDPTEINMTVGDDPVVITANVTPGTAVDKTVTWSVDGDEVTLVDNKDGTATITAVDYTAVGEVVTITATNASGNQAFVTVTVKEIVGINVTGPTKTMYYVGETLDTTGMKVEAVYSDGTTVDVTEESVVDTTVLNAPGNPVVIGVAYGDFEGSFNVVVGAVNGFTVQLPDPLYAGTTLTVDNLGMMVNYTNGLESRPAVADNVVFEPVTVQMGDESITITYTEGGFSSTQTFEIVVVEPVTEPTE